MTLIELAQKLNELGYPVAYSHFKKAQKLPFICYLVIDSDNFIADNKVYREILNVDIELYSNKDFVAEEKIKKMLNDNELPYSFNEVYIKEEEVFKSTFSIQI